MRTQPDHLGGDMQREGKGGGHGLIMACLRAFRQAGAISRAVNTALFFIGRTVVSVCIKVLMAASTHKGHIMATNKTSSTNPDRKDKAGHQDNDRYDRMHAREPQPGDKEKADRPYRAKDAPKNADKRRSNPDRDRAQR